MKIFVEAYTLQIHLHKYFHKFSYFIKLLDTADIVGKHLVY